MISIAGTKYFELRTFTFRELGIPPIGESKKYTIEVVQAYFHLFSIPIFGLGKQIKLGHNGDFLDLPPDLAQKIDRKTVNAPIKWYSFGGIYLLAITFALFFADKKVEENRLEKLFSEAKATQLNYLKNPAVGDLYFFASKSEDLRAEVHQISPDSVQITLQKAFQHQKSSGIKHHPKFKNEEEKLNTFVEAQERKNFISDSLKTFYPKENLLRSLMTAQILGEDVSFIQFWISKFDLKKSFCPENNCKSIKIKNPANEFRKPVLLKAVEREKTKYE